MSKKFPWMKIFPWFVLSDKGHFSLFWFLFDNWLYKNSLINRRTWKINSIRNFLRVLYSSIFTFERMWNRNSMIKMNVVTFFNHWHWQQSLSMVCSFLLMKAIFIWMVFYNLNVQLCSSLILLVECLSTETSNTLADFHWFHFSCKTFIHEPFWDSENGTQI